MGKNKGQTSVEFLVLLVVTMLVLSVTIAISIEHMTSINEQKEHNDANNAVMDLSGAAKEVYAQGEGAKKQVYVVIPSSYEPSLSYVGNQAIRLNARGNDYVAVEDFKVRGSLPGTDGVHWIWVISEGNQVRIGDAMLDFDKNRIFVVMYANSTMSAPFSVTNIWKAALNVSTNTTWTASDVSMSGVPSDFYLGTGDNYAITLQFTSGPNSSGFYNGQIDFIATDPSNITETDSLPITVEVISSGNPLYPTWDIQGPVIESIYQQPMPAVKLQPLTIYVNVSDILTGNHTIKSCQIDADSTYNWQDMLPADGAFDNTTEVAQFDYTSGFTLGPHIVGVKCTDANDNVGPKAYYYFEVTESDQLGPIVIQMSHDSYPTTLSNLTFYGKATDAYTGGNTVASCAVKIGISGSWNNASADDGSWDNITENFSYTSGPLGVGYYTVGYQCVDSLGNVGGEYNDSFGVVDVDLMLALDRSGSMADNVTNATNSATASATSSGWSWAKDLVVTQKNGNIANLGVALKASTSGCMASYNATVNGVTLASGNRTNITYGTLSSTVDVSALEPPYTISLWLKRNASGCTASTNYISLQQAPQKVQAAKDGGNAFLNVSGNNIQAGLVSFSTSSTLDKTIALMIPANQATLRTSINALSPSGYTCIECALKKAADELTSSRARPTANKVIILLTDGMGNKGADGSDCTTACSVAGAVYCRDRNITVYTIGFGNDVDDTELMNIALLTNGDYYYAPNAQTLTAIFQSIGKH